MPVDIVSVDKKSDNIVPDRKSDNVAPDNRSQSPVLTGAVAQNSPQKETPVRPPEEKFIPQKNVEKKLPPPERPLQKDAALWQAHPSEEFQRANLKSGDTRDSAHSNSSLPASADKVIRALSESTGIPSPHFSETASLSFLTKAVAELAKVLGSGDKLFQGAVKSVSVLAHSVEGKPAASETRAANGLQIPSSSFLTSSQARVSSQTQTAQAQTLGVLPAEGNLLNVGSQKLAEALASLLLFQAGGQVSSQAVLQNVVSFLGLSPEQAKQLFAGISAQKGASNLTLQQALKDQPLALRNFVQGLVLLTSQPAFLAGATQFLVPVLQVLFGFSLFQIPQMNLSAFQSVLYGELAALMAKKNRRFEPRQRKKVGRPSRVTGKSRSNLIDLTSEDEEEFQEEIETWMTSVPPPSTVTSFLWQ